MFERVDSADGYRVLVEFQLAREEFETFARWQVRRLKVVRRLTVLVGIETLLGIGLAFTPAASVGVTLLILSVVQAVIYGSLWGTAPRRAWGKTTGDLRGSQTIEFSDAGLHSRSVNSESESRWGVVMCAVEHGDLYLLGLASRRWVIIPKRAFSSPENEARFRVIVADHTAAELL